MQSFAKNTGSNLIPCLRYRDLPAAIDWLCQAFGFAPQQVFSDPDGGIQHAQLAFGSSLLMLGPVTDSDYGRLLVQPEAIGRLSSQGLYVVVTSADGLYAQAKAAGAQIVIELRDEAYGGRGFSCRDPEGHLWSFGSYDPWEPPAVDAAPDPQFNT